MANPTFRFWIEHAQAGTFSITEPKGWLDSKLTLERDQEFHSLIEKFTTAFTFYGNNGTDNGGADIIRGLIRDFGIDTDIYILTDISVDGGLNYYEFFRALYDATVSEETNLNQIKSGLIRDDVWSKFISRQETPVNLQDPKDLDGTLRTIVSPEDINLSSQIIDQKGQFQQKQYINFGRIYDVTEIDPSFQIEIANGQSVQFDFYDPVFDEIKNKYSIPVAPVPVGGDPAEVYGLQYAGTYDIDLKISLTHLEYDAPAIRDYQDLSSKFDLFIKFDNDAPIQLTRTDKTVTFLIPPSMTSQTNNWSEYTYTGTKTLPAGGKIKIYGTNVSGGDFGYANNSITVLVDQLIMLGNSNNDIQWQPAATRSGVYKTDFGVPPGIGSYFNITGHTVFPESGAFGFLVHDAGYSITDRICAPLYSEFLGSTSTNARQYASDGCGWKNLIVKGLQLRTYTLPEKPFFLSFKDWWDGINPILNLGLTYDTMGGEQVIRVEEKGFFYDDSVSVRFDYVHEIIRRYDNDVIFNKIDQGYKKWESENASGIDDPHTKHIYATRFKKVGQTIEVESGFIAASLAIEQTRRQMVEKTKDWKLDNDTFIIAVEESDSSPGRLRPELAENFSLVTNLLNYVTRYNLRLTPARNFLRWRKFYNGALQSYLTSQYKFVSGEGNYDTVTDLIDSTPSCDEYQTSISEKQNIDVTSDYYHLPDLFEMTIDCTWEQYLSVRTNREKGIEISQTASGHVTFYIKSFDYEPVNSKAVILAWPKTPFQITNTDFVQPVRVCEESPGTCADALLTELLVELTTESEDCLTI